MTIACPCGSESEYNACCGPVLDGAPATTAVALMRSRYTAYAVGRFDHLETSLSAKARAQFNRSAAENMAEGIKWLGLEVRSVAGGTVDDQEGTVEFIARYKERDQEMAHHELASFVREDGRWVFSEGKAAPKGEPRRVNHVGRNDPCPCGSGKKFKKCHGA